jgi:hypothetical protein
VPGAEEGLVVAVLGLAMLAVAIFQYSRAE